jgi:hypothetical protein
VAYEWPMWVGSQVRFNPNGGDPESHGRGKNLPAKGEKRLGASPNRFPGCVLEVVLTS